MKGSEFIRKVKRLGSKQAVPVKFVVQRGKGSHGTLSYGDRMTIVRNPTDELTKGALHGMLDQLGLTLEDIQRRRKTSKEKEIE